MKCMEDKNLVTHIRVVANAIDSLRICVLARAIPAHGGGGMEQAIWRLVCTWAQMGHSIDIFTTPLRAGSSWENPAPDKIRVITLSGPPAKYSRKWFRATRSIPFKNYDIVFSVSTAARNVVNICRDLGVPVVMQAHGTSLDEIITKVHLRTLRGLVTLPKNIFGLVYNFYDFPRYTCVVAISWSVESSIKCYPKFAQPQMMLVIPNGVEKNDHVNQRATSSVYRISFAGRLHREKGVDLLLREAVGLNAMLSIAGEGPAASELKKLATKLYPEGNVSFLGKLSPDEVVELFSDSDLVVLPSRRREGLPLVALEALNSGAPIIVSSGVARGFPPQDLPLGVTITAMKSGSLRKAILEKMAAKANYTRVCLPPKFELKSVTTEYIVLFNKLIEGSTTPTPRKQNEF